MRKIILFTLLATVTMAFAQTRRMKLYFNTGSVIIYNVDDLDSLVWEVDEDDAPYYNNDTKETVDLGLSVKWATCNVGANSPEEYGDYFAWGETEPKSSYDFTTYKWCNGSYNTLTKYNTNSDYGTVDNNKTLESADDAAIANWHGAWRMPTDKEQKALRDSCYWEWTTSYNGKSVNGYIVYKAKDAKDMGKQKTSGSSITTEASYSLSDAHIFLPAAGRLFPASLDSAGSCGNYWSASLYESRPYYALSMHFESYGVSSNHNGRDNGHSVRPVLQD